VLTKNTRERAMLFARSASCVPLRIDECRAKLNGMRIGSFCWLACAVIGCGDTKSAPLEGPNQAETDAALDAATLDAATLDTANLDAATVDGTAPGDAAIGTEEGSMWPACGGLLSAVGVCIFLRPGEPAQQAFIEISGVLGTKPPSGELTFTGCGLMPDHYLSIEGGDAGGTIHVTQEGAA
jgi:hypothetical protein